MKVFPKKPKTSALCGILNSMIIIKFTITNTSPLVYLLGAKLIKDAVYHKTILCS